MHPNAALIERFYQAFARRDHRTMGRCYAPDAVFGDPVFPRLVGDEIGAMWRMLCERGADLEIVFSDISADHEKGGAHWEARYTFSRTGRRVVNRIDAAFEFRDGLIVGHRDRFGFYRWSRQALGPVGWLLGWSPLVRNKVRSQAGRQLAREMER